MKICNFLNRTKVKVFQVLNKSESKLLYENSKSRKLQNCLAVLTSFGGTTFDYTYSCGFVQTSVSNCCGENGCGDVVINDIFWL